MSILKQARVEGLWNNMSVAVSLDPRVNFLIGANGSGKTTFLNLIASALSSDYDGLARTPFSLIECVLTSATRQSEVRVIVQGSGAEELRRPSFSYTIQIPGEQDETFELMSPTPRYLLPVPARQKARPSRAIFDDDESPLDKHVRIKWLTVHRAPSKQRNEERPLSDSSVDRRLTYLSNQLVRYFSKLAADREKETNRFLRQMLSVLVYNASELDPFVAAKSIDLAEVQTSIEALLETFLGGAAKDNMDRLHAHFKLAAEARKDKEQYELDELIALAAVLPMQKIVEEWNRTQEKQEVIAKPRTDFLETINSMYRRKTLSLNVKNELEVDLATNKRLTLAELSSGEKQLLIIFAEALLQESSEFIYIADEPELSLHVTWQEQLTKNLLRINPRAQVIFATHSPDIVSQFGDNAIDMESLIS